MRTNYTRDAGAVTAAARRVRELVDNLTHSWRMLPDQLKWAIDARLTDAGLGGHTLTRVKWEMQDGTPTFWQRFWLAPAETQREQVRAAIARLDQGGK